MSELERSEVASALCEGVILLGMKSDRPHAARFLPSESELAAKAAKLMGLHLVVLDSPEKVAAAEGIAVGKIFASGKSFCPYAKQLVFEKIASLSRIDIREEVHSEGSVEVDVSRTPRIEPVEAQLRFPTNWDDLGPGCLCLASEGEGHGWFEVIVLSAAPDGFIVVWRGFRDLGNFARRSDQLALLPPDFAHSDNLAST